MFAVSRFIGTSIAMIDIHYGHLARDSREHAVSLLDALAVERPWTPRGRRTKAARTPSATAIRDLAGTTCAEP